MKTGTITLSFYSEVFIVDSYQKIMDTF